MLLCRTVDHRGVSVEWSSESLVEPSKVEARLVVSSMMGNDGEEGQWKCWAFRFAFGFTENSVLGFMV